MTYWMEKPSLWGRWGIRVLMLVIAVVMLFPFVYVIAVSFSSYQDVVGGNLVIIPSHPNLDAYDFVLKGGQMVQALQVSGFVTIVGTLFNLFMTTTMAYALSRRGVPGLKIVLWLVLLTLLISPGIIPRYLVVKQFGLIDNVWSLILPGAIGPFNLIVMRQFFMSIPEELLESAKLDGATDLRILWNIVLPLSKAVIAAVGLFYAVAHWNEFFDATIFINSPQKNPAAVLLRLIVLQGGRPVDETIAGQVPPPDLTIQMAVVVLTTLPILLIYPFLQRYFTKGVLTGSIKG